MQGVSEAAEFSAKVDLRVYISYLMGQRLLPRRQNRLCGRYICGALDDHSTNNRLWI